MSSQIDLEQELRELGRTLIVAPPATISLSRCWCARRPKRRARGGCRPGGVG
jgi:hypothetical protein